MAALGDGQGLPEYNDKRIIFWGCKARFEGKDYEEQLHVLRQRQIHYGSREICRLFEDRGWYQERVDRSRMWIIKAKNSQSKKSLAIKMLVITGIYLIITKMRQPSVSRNNSVKPEVESWATSPKPRIPSSKHRNYSSSMVF